MLSLRGTAVLAAVLAAGAAGVVGGTGGCARKAGVLFEPLAQPLVWPEPPDPPRIHYLGALATEQDLKPGRSFGQALGDAVFGKSPIRSMLTPISIAGDGKDRIFVCDSNAQLVHVFNLRTRRYEQWRPPTKPAAPGATLLAQPVGIAHDPRGRILVCDPVVAAVYVFDENGRGEGWIGQGYLERPCGIAVDPLRDRIYVADTGAHQVVALDSAGELIAKIGGRGDGEGEFNFPTYVAVDAQGWLYVSDSLNFRIQVFDPELRRQGQIGRRGNRPGYFSQPKGVAVDQHGHVYVVDSHFEAVQIFNRAGQLLLSFGQEGRGPGQFWLPAGIFIGPDDRIWVADTYNRRVQVFEYRPVADNGPGHAAARPREGRP